MDWTDTQEVQAVVVMAVSLLLPMLLALVRRLGWQWQPDDKWKATAVAMVTAFIVAAAATPGDWRTKAIAGVTAAVLSQGTYNVARVAAKAGE